MTGTGRNIAVTFWGSFATGGTATNEAQVALAEMVKDNLPETMRPIGVIFGVDVYKVDLRFSATDVADLDRAERESKAVEVSEHRGGGRKRGAAALLRGASDAGWRRTAAR